MPAEVKRQPASLPLFIAALVPIWVLWSGYTFGFANHNEQLPLIARAMDANFLRNDWFVNSNQGFNHRTAYTLLMAGLARVFGLETVCFFGYLLLAFFLAWGVARLSEELGFSRPAAMAAATFVLFNRTGAVGFVSLTEQVMLPGFLAWTLGVWGMVFLLKERHHASAGLLLVTGIFHWLIGPETVLLAVGAALLVWRGEQRHELVRRLPLYAIAFLTPLVLAWWAGCDGGHLSVAQASEELFVLTHVRHPWHYIPQTFPMAEWTGLVMFAALALVARRIVRPVAWLDALTVLALIFAFFGFVPTWINELFPLAKLQTFRMTVWAQVAVGIYIGTAAAKCLESLGQRISTERMPLNPAFRAVSVAGWLLLLAAWQGAVPTFAKSLVRKVNVHGATKNEMDMTAQWARENTEPSAVFLVPPVAENFRWQARRAVVVDFKTFPWRSGGMLEWRARLQEVCGGRKMTLGWKAAPQLDAAYRALTPQQLREIARKFDASFVVLPANQPFDEPPVFSNRSWKICSLTTK